MGIRRNGTKGNDMEFLNHRKWNIAVILVSIILLVSATVHRGQLDLSRQEYIESLLIQYFGQFFEHASVSGCFGNSEDSIPETT